MIRTPLPVVATMLVLLTSGMGTPRGAARSADPAWSLDARAEGGTLTVKIGLAQGSGYRVVAMPLEDYVAGVLVGEAAPGSAPAALQALAIAIRTYTVANLGRHRAQGFDLCDQTHCQVYRAPTAITRQAAEATAGEVLFYDGAPASIYFSAWCGGFTERPSHVWPGAPDVPYLPSKPDPACARLPGWSADVRLADLGRALRAAGFRGHLRRMSPSARDESGRVTRLRLDGLTPSTISGQDLRMAVGKTIGWQLIKSTEFSMRATRDGYKLTGRGYGHGVGLCVRGSMARAIAGESAAQILAYYFPGTRMATIAAGTTAIASSVRSPRAARPAKPAKSVKPAKPEARPCPKGALRPQPYPSPRPADPCTGF